MNKATVCYVVLLLAGMCGAQTTPNLGFNVPTPGTQFNTWGQLENYNFFLLDSYLGGTGTLPNLSVSGTMTAGHFVGPIGDTSPSTGTFTSITGPIGSISPSTGSFTGITGPIGQSVPSTGAFTSTSVVNAGVFTNAQENQYLTSMIGGISSTLFHDLCSGCGFTTEAITGGVNVPLGAGIHQGFGVNGLSDSSCNALSRTTCNSGSFFGLATVSANNAAAWGWNVVVQGRSAGLNGTNYTGGEIDMGVQDTPSYVRGLNITMSIPFGASAGTMPVTAANCMGLIGGGCPGAAMEINSGSPLLQWQKGLIFTDSSFNSALDVLEIGATSYSGANFGSYSACFARWDSGAARHVDDCLKASSVGDLQLSAAPGRAVQMGGGGSTFSALPTGAGLNGSLIYCNDCKNVPDDSASPGAACTGSGSGSLARRENNRWDCN